MSQKTAWFVLGLAIMLGLIFAWVDSRPNWDDTGVLVAAIFLTTAVLGLTFPDWPWLWALAVGVWIPIVGILHGNYAAILILIIPFAGAYCGAWSHKAFIMLSK